MDLDRVQATAFEGSRCFASGPLFEVALRAKDLVDRGEREPVLVFDDASGRLIEVDYRGTPWQVLERLAAQAPVSNSGAAPDDGGPHGTGPRRRGRPRLGVVAREVTLLPRHWEWLASQPGGASVALRRLVDEARKRHDAQDQVRQAREAAYRFMQAMAGDLPGFEQATRALFAGDDAGFTIHTATWPADVASYARRLQG